MNQKPIIHLDAKQVAEVYLDRLVDFFQSGVKPEEALVKTLESLARDVAEQRELTEEALAESAKYKHPKTGAGILADKNVRMQRYISEGVKDAAEEQELLAIPSPGSAQKKRLIAVRAELVKDAANVKATQDAISSDEGNYALWLERYHERMTKLKGLKADYESLKEEGPALIAQIKDHQRAEEARRRDEMSQLGQGSSADAQNMLAGLRDQAAQAGRLEDAADLVEEELEGEPSLDEELAAQDSAAENAAIIEMFRGKASK
jgi:hypothetical protein